MGLVRNTDGGGHERRDDEAETETAERQVQRQRRVCDRLIPRAHQEEASRAQQQTYCRWDAHAEAPRGVTAEQRSWQYGPGEADETQSPFPWRLAQHGIGHERHRHERHDEGRADQQLRRHRRREPSSPEQSFADDRLDGAQLHDGERRQQPRASHDRQIGRGRAACEQRPLGEGQRHECKPSRQQQTSRHVEPPTLLRYLGYGEQRQEQQTDNREVRPEYPSPPEQVDDRAAVERTEHRAGLSGRAHDAEDDRPALGGPAHAS